MKITKGLIREIIKLDNLTLQDVDALKQFIAEGLHNQNGDRLLYKALFKYNYWQKKTDNKGYIAIEQLLGLLYFSGMLLVIIVIAFIF